MAKNKKVPSTLLQKKIVLNKPIIGLLGIFVLLLFLLYVVKFVQTSYQSKAGYYNQAKESFSCHKKEDGESCRRLVCGGSSGSMISGNDPQGMELEERPNGQQRPLTVSNDRISDNCQYEPGICQKKRCVALEGMDEPGGANMPGGMGVNSFPGVVSEPGGGVGGWKKSDECEGQQDGSPCVTGASRCRVNANGQEICRMDAGVGRCYQGVCFDEQSMELPVQPDPAPIY